jgi:hypothetical protein
MTPILRLIAGDPTTSYYDWKAAKQTPLSIGKNQKTIKTNKQDSVRLKSGVTSWGEWN